MAMQLKKVVPWGRSREEYFAMFNLDKESHRIRILACGDGPASFNAEMTEAGGSVVSFDPIYVFSAEQIQRRFEASVEEVMGQVTATPDKWVWKFHKNPEQLKRNRLKALTRFLADYETGRRERRYVPAEFPNLPFDNDTFDLSLCSHFLFLYSEHFSEVFHIRSVLEMCRVASEVRIFPLLTLAQDPSPHLKAVRREVASKGYQSEIRSVEYELQPGGNKMLRIFK